MIQLQSLRADRGPKQEVVEMFGRVFSSFLAVLLVSSSSLACPDLTGNWVCPNQQLKFKINSEYAFDTNFLKVIGGNDLGMADVSTFALEVGAQVDDREPDFGVCGSDSVVVNVKGYFGQDKVTIRQRSFILLDNNTLKISLESAVSPEKDITIICKRFSPLK